MATEKKHPPWCDTAHRAKLHQSCTGAVTNRALLWIVVVALRCAEPCRTRPCRAIPELRRRRPVPLVSRRAQNPCVMLRTFVRATPLVWFAGWRFRGKLSRLHCASSQWPIVIKRNLLFESRWSKTAYKYRVVAGVGRDKQSNVEKSLEEHPMPVCTFWFFMKLPFRIFAGKQ